MLFGPSIFVRKSVQLASFQSPRHPECVQVVVGVVFALKDDLGGVVVLSDQRRLAVALARLSASANEGVGHLDPSCPARRQVEDRRSPCREEDRTVRDRHGRLVVAPLEAEDPGVGAEEAVLGDDLDRATADDGVLPALAALALRVGRGGAFVVGLEFAGAEEDAILDRDPVVAPARGIRDDGSDALRAGPQRQLGLDELAVRDLVFALS